MQTGQKEYKKNQEAEWEQVMQLHDLAMCNDVKEANNNEWKE